MRRGGTGGGLSGAGFGSASRPSALTAHRPRRISQDGAVLVALVPGADRLAAMPRPAETWNFEGVKAPTFLTNP